MKIMKKILLIEDDDIDAKITIRTLKNLSIDNEIIRLETGQEFLDFMGTEKSQEIGLALLDLNMPQLGGIETLEILRSQSEFRRMPIFPIIVFSSSDQEEDILKCYNLGINAYVAKPSSRKDYKEVLQSIVQFWIYTNRLPKLSA